MTRQTLSDDATTLTYQPVPDWYDETDFYVSSDVTTRPVRIELEGSDL